LLSQDMLRFLPDYLEDYYKQHCRGDDDKLIQLTVSFQRSMYCVTSAVIQALCAALNYPLDDPNPEHLKVNRAFFEAQMDRLLRPEARINEVQNQEYR
jgi:hypothetical protein